MTIEQFHDENGLACARLDTSELKRILDKSEKENLSPVQVRELLMELVKNIPALGSLAQGGKGAMKNIKGEELDQLGLMLSPVRASMPPFKEAK